MIYILQFVVHITHLLEQLPNNLQNRFKPLGANVSHVSQLILNHCQLLLDRPAGSSLPVHDCPDTHIPFLSRRFKVSEFRVFLDFPQSRLSTHVCSPLQQPSTCPSTGKGLSFETSRTRSCIPRVEEICRHRCLRSSSSRQFVCNSCTNVDREREREGQERRGGVELSDGTVSMGVEDVHLFS